MRVFVATSIAKKSNEWDQLALLQYSGTACFMAEIKILANNRRFLLKWHYWRIVWCHEMLCLGWAIKYQSMIWLYKHANIPWCKSYMTYCKLPRLNPRGVDRNFKRKSRDCTCFSHENQFKIWGNVILDPNEACIVFRRIFSMEAI